LKNGLSSWYYINMSDGKDNEPTPEELSKIMAYLANRAVAKRRLNPEKMRDDSRKGGLIGGRARAASLSPERRSEIAKNAVAARNAKRAAKNTEKDVDKI